MKQLLTRDYWSHPFNPLAAAAFEKFTIFPKGSQKKKVCSQHELVQSWEITSERCSAKVRTGTSRTRGTTSSRQID